MSNSISVAITGAGGAGVITVGQLLLDAAAQAGLYGLMTRSSGPQIRGGEAAAFVWMSTDNVSCAGNRIDLFMAFDWNNVDRFSAELPLDANSLVLYNEGDDDIPEMVKSSGATLVALPIKRVAKGIPSGRINMVGFGILCRLVGISEEFIESILEAALSKKGREAVVSSGAAFKAGYDLAAAVDDKFAFSILPANSGERWVISGNEGAGLGALRGGVRFVAAYPITPATEILEWLAPNLEKVGGSLVQAEDELASINQIIGASFGGTPSMTATSGPGLALMTESLGLSVSSETPVIVVNVQRGGPSTGIPTKSEQTDLNIALHGLHGDAPHIVTAPNSIPDCIFTTQWSVYLAECLQAPAIVLSDQALGQSRIICDKPADVAFMAKRLVATDPTTEYQRYAITETGVSPMAIPGTPGGEYVADGLETDPQGRPSSAVEDHHDQLDKRQRKLDQFKFGDHWADVEGDGEMAIITWGSTTAPVREAISRANGDGASLRLISIRLLAPVQTEKFAQVLRGVSKALIIEQSHSKQFYHYLRAYYDLPDKVSVFSRPGPLPMRSQEILAKIVAWS